ncbi:hypothetical protein, partial [Actinoallomurus acaciae]
MLSGTERRSLNAGPAGWGCAWDGTGLGAGGSCGGPGGGPGLEGGTPCGRDERDGAVEPEPRP